MTTRRAVTARVLAIGIGTSVVGCLGSDGGSADGSGNTDDGSSRYTGPMVGDTELAPDFPVLFTDVETDEEAAEVHWHGSAGQGEWHYQPLEIPLGEARTFEITVLDAEFEEIDISDGSGYEVIPVPPNGDDGPVLEAEMAGDGTELTIHGIDEGRTDFRIEVRGPDGGSWTSPGLRVHVVSGD